MVISAKKKGTIEFATPEEGWALLDERAQRYLKMSASEFIEAWDAGTIEDPDRPEVMRVAMLLPFVR